MDAESLVKDLILKEMTPEQQQAILDSVRSSVEQARALQKQKVGENVDLVVQALKKIESDIRSRYDDLGNKLEQKLIEVKSVKDGVNGRDGKDGMPGRDGLQGPQGMQGPSGRDGVDGVDGVSVTNAYIDFDGGLVITLSNGNELNVGEIVPMELASQIKVITNGGGTSQSVLDTLDYLQSQINTLIPSQTGNAGKFLTTDGTTTSWATAGGAGGLSYQGTWNASTNTPTLASSTGTNGYYYIVATAGSTNLNGITDWQIGDWLLFNGSVWQKIDQTNLVSSVNGQTGVVSLTYTDVNAIGSITSTDGSVTVSTASGVADLSVAVAASTTNVICQVRNTTGATLTKGTVVYITGATGQLPTVSKAIATGDSTSAQTLGVMSANLANNSNGYVTIIGLVSNIDTSAYTDGAQLYLSPTTAGTYTTTKPYAPDHLVYVAVVEHAHPTQGKLFVKVQNGYEMDELHNVSAQSPSNGQTLVYNTSTSLWEKNTVSLTAGVNGTLPIANGGTGSTTAGDALTALGAYAASNPSGYTSNVGTVTSVSATVPSVFSISGSPITSSGTLAISYSGTALPVANGGTGQTSYTDGQLLIGNSTGNTLSKATLTAGSGISITNGSGSISISATNSGTVTSVSGTAPIASSGGNTPAISISQATTSTDGYLSSTDWNTFNNKQAAGTYVTSVSGTTGRITSSGGTTPAIDLASGIVTAGTTGSATVIPVITVDTYGRVTSVTTASNPQGTVTDVTATSPIVSSGGATPAISLASNYGDTQNPYASKTANYVLAAPNGSSGAPTFRAIVAADIPTLNQNTTGTASNVTGVVAIANGGTGATTAGDALTSLGAYPASNPNGYTSNTGTVTSVTGTSPVSSSGGNTPAISLESGYGDTLNPYTSKTANYVLASPNGSAGIPTFRAIVASDIPTLNQNTTGTASNVTGTVAIANGGTGTSTPGLVAGANVTITGSWPNQTIATSGSGSGTVTSVAASVPSFLSISGSPITTSGTLAITYSGTALPIANGGTGVTSTPTDGQLLIGNGTGYTASTLTAGSNITITNSSGGITIASTGGSGITTGKSIAMAMIFGF